ncbi:uncharacterized protein PGTG_06516 [Puccinia graminis f. sp. tritici CRL 75-36-700-3]|uniref:Uncharacterized protein n=1 Tax=Puccinia graminis f. sp. tritici (strain CRL 75-36-700-3 / race SCCL) TaxID=418459 RepID=E3K8Z5_PUCGT|nr:uncharacterized protein PGTG_06516 [Puccinia graminis f. sp. tritici CRL 75-36-700-3]EFP80560.2 hypothetical protein PGTG_06516 [Puccinia graminis f. sp. tritici CRL 75-36-700-3]
MLKRYSVFGQVRCQPPESWNGIQCANDLLSIELHSCGTSMVFNSMDGVSTGLGVVKETRHRTAPEEVAKASSMKSQCKTSEILHTGAETCIYGHRRTLPAQITVYPGGSLNHPIRNPDTGGFNKLIVLALRDLICAITPLSLHATSTCINCLSLPHAFPALLLPLEPPPGSDNREAT